MTSHYDKPEVLIAACHALQELIDFCPNVLTEIGEEAHGNALPVHNCCMAVLMLHADNLELCESACRVLATMVSMSNPLREVRWKRSKVMFSLYKVKAYKSTLNQFILLINTWSSLYYTHFEISGGPCNLIGSNCCNLFMNCTIFCLKSHFSQPMRRLYYNKTTNQISRLV